VNKLGVGRVVFQVQHLDGGVRHWRFLGVRSTKMTFLVLRKASSPDAM